MSRPNPKLYMFVDLETTGLSPEHDSIVEIAVILARYVDDKMQEYNRYQALVAPSTNWSVWAVEQHRRSGLLGLLETSQDVQTVGVVGAEIRSMIAGFLMSAGDGATSGGKLTLAGRNVHFDRGFIERYMPAVAQHLHYRHLDIATIEMFLENARIRIDTLNDAPHRAWQDVSSAFRTYQEYEQATEHHMGQAQMSQKEGLPYAR